MYTALAKVVAIATIKCVSKVAFLTSTATKTSLKHIKKFQ